MPPKPHGFYAAQLAASIPETAWRCQAVYPRKTALLFLAFGGCWHDGNGHGFRINALNLITLLDQLELFRILDLQANGPGRATQGDRLILAVNLLHVGDESNFLDLIAGRLLALGGRGGFAAIDPLAQRAAARPA